jgi:cellulose synthase/poly-beta-1,6-N-acetylglucosamine synthase-like glycosyltransferase
MSAALVLAVQWVVLAFFAVVSALQVALMVSAGIELRQVLRRRPPAGMRRTLRSPFSPTVSLLVPAYNEETMIATTVESMLAIEYPMLEVVVVNDGSSDGTLAALRDRFGLEPAAVVDVTRLTSQPVRGVYRSSTHPHLLVVDSENGGKAHALNVALGHASGQLVCAVDADTIIEPDALGRLVEPFIADPSLLAAGGSVRPVNGCRVRHGRVVERRSPTRFLAGVQAAEYGRAFLFGRLGWNRLGGNIIISGAFGLFDRRAVVEAGGYLESTVGEDMELVLRLRRRAMDAGRPARVSFLPEPMAWTEVPESARTLARQRNRWHRGLADALWHHRGMVGRPRYGRTGLVVIPYYLLELVSPVVEAAGLLALAVGLALGIVNVPVAVLFFLLAYGFSIALSAVAAGFEDRIDQDRLEPGHRRRRVWWLLLEQLGYRQLTVWWRLRGLAAWLRGDGHWGAQERRGLPGDLPEGTGAPGDVPGPPVSGSAAA